MTERKNALLLKDGLEQAIGHQVKEIGTALTAQLDNFDRNDPESVGSLVRSLLCYNLFLGAVDRLMAATRLAAKTDIARLAIEYVESAENGQYSTATEQIPHSKLFDEIVERLNRNTYYAKLIEEQSLEPSRNEMRPFELLVEEARTNAAGGFVSLYLTYKVYDTALRNFLYRACELLNLNPERRAYFHENDVRECLHLLVEGFVAEGMETPFIPDSMFRHLSQASYFLRNMFDITEEQTRVLLAVSPTRRAAVVA